MNGEQYDDKSLRRYLLNSLPEQETEGFDELSIVDDEFAARLEEVEDDLIDTHVRGELFGDEKAQFQSYYLASPRRREKVEFAQMFQSFAKQKMLAKSSQTAATVAETPVQESRFEEPERNGRLIPESVPWWHSVVNMFAIPNLTLQWSLVAAAMLLMMAGIWLVVETLRVRGQLEQGQTERAMLQQRAGELQAQLDEQRSASAKDTRQLREELTHTQEKLARLERQRLAQQQARTALPDGLNIAHFDFAPQTRAIGRAVTLPIPPGTDYVNLQLELKPADYPAYQAELRTETGNQLVWSSGRLRARAKGENKVIDVSIRADRLTTRGYILMLKGIADDGSEKDAPSYAFRVVKQ